MDELERRLDAAEQKYIEANLEARLKELEEAKQRQVIFSRKLLKNMKINCFDNILAPKKDRIKK